MKNQMVRVELNNGDVLIGVEVSMKDEHFHSLGIPIELSFMCKEGIWLVHSANNRKLSFLAHENIISKTIIK